MSENQDMEREGGIWISLPENEACTYNSLPLGNNSGIEDY